MTIIHVSRRTFIASLAALVAHPKSLASPTPVEPFQLDTKAPDRGLLERLSPGDTGYIRQSGNRVICWGRTDEDGKALFPLVMQRETLNAYVQPADPDQSAAVLWLQGTGMRTNLGGCYYIAFGHIHA